MIKLIAIGVTLVVASTVDARILQFATRLDKSEFGFFEPIEITSEIRVAGNSLDQAYPEGICGNVVYEVEYQFNGAFLRHKQDLHGAGGFIRHAKVQDVSIDDTPLISTMDLRILFRLDAGRYRVRGRYRSDPRSVTFESVSEWSEFQVSPKTQREAVIFEEFEATGAGNTPAEKLATYQAFAAKYPAEYITTRVYDEMLNYYFKFGDEEHRLDLLKSMAANPNISKLKRRLIADEIGDLEQKRGRTEEAVGWYRQCGLGDSDAKIANLNLKAE